MKQIAHLDSKRSTSEDLLKLSDTPESSVNLANTFFARVGATLASNIKPQDTLSSSSSSACWPPIVLSTHSPPVDSMCLLPTDCNEIELVILRLKDKCAVGYDGIPTSVIKGARHALIPILKYIFNLSFETGKFPDVLKKALVHPIHKSGDKKDINNYRPISVLTVLSKILEKIINCRLINFLDESGTLSNNQFGFRRGKSTEDAVVGLSTSIAKNFALNLKSVGIFLDLAKAFDTVSIPILLTKLEQIGIRGTVNQLFKSYLSDRRQTVSVNNVTSDEEVITFGVPQGSVLGPTLFLVYINGLCQLSIPNCSIFTYADDTALIVSGRDWNETKQSAEIALQTVLNWLSMNFLTLNVSKTKIITFSPSSRSQPSSFSLRAHNCFDTNICKCQSLERTTSIKYLGVYLDNFLSWTHHTNSTISRVRKLIFIFKRLRNAADSKCLKTVYFALAQSVLSYCITAWGGAIKTQVLRVERAQRAILKVMHSKPRRFPTDQLYSLSEVLTVRQLFVQSTLLRKHSELQYDPCLQDSKRRSDIVCRGVPWRVAAAGRQYHFLSPSLYNRINRILNIYPLPLYKCKIKCSTWLLSLTYEETEELLITLK